MGAVGNASPGGGSLLMAVFYGIAYLTAASTIILLNKQCQNNDVQLRLSNISDSVMEVFKLMRLNRVLKIDKTEEKALDAFDNKGGFWG